MFDSFVFLLLTYMCLTLLFQFQRKSSLPCAVTLSIYVATSNSCECQTDVDQTLLWCCSPAGMHVPYELQWLLNDPLVQNIVSICHVQPLITKTHLFKYIENFTFKN